MGDHVALKIKTKKMKTELKNAIKTVKETDSKWLKNGMNKNICLAFIKQGEDLEFGANTGSFGFQFNEGLCVTTFWGSGEDYFINNKTSLLKFLKAHYSWYLNYKN